MQRKSEEFRLYVYKQLDIQELLELNGVSFSTEVQWMFKHTEVCYTYFLVQ